MKQFFTTTQLFTQPPPKTKMLHHITIYVLAMCGYGGLLYDNDSDGSRYDGARIMNLKQSINQQSSLFTQGGEVTCAD